VFPAVAAPERTQPPGGGGGGGGNQEATTGGPGPVGPDNGGDVGEESISQTMAREDDDSERKDGNGNGGGGEEEEEKGANAEREREVARQNAYSMAHALLHFLEALVEPVIMTALYPSALAAGSRDDAYSVSEDPKNKQHCYETRNNIRLISALLLFRFCRSSIRCLQRYVAVASSSLRRELLFFRSVCSHTAFLS
jgi:hypothetical protein